MGTLDRFPTSLPTLIRCSGRLSRPVPQAPSGEIHLIPKLLALPKANDRAGKQCLGFFLSWTIGGQKHGADGLTVHFRPNAQETPQAVSGQPLLGSLRILHHHAAGTARPEPPKSQLQRFAARGEQLVAMRPIKPLHLLPQPFLLLPQLLAGFQGLLFQLCHLAMQTALQQTLPSVARSHPAAPSAGSPRPSTEERVIEWWWGCHEQTRIFSHFAHRQSF